ncbi:MAG: hypothetical protein GY862_13740 [Gammaproteobacteria bacterium]|nr:hypothetical protein [Gammaproteobacteria bacterium]
MILPIPKGTDAAARITDLVRQAVQRRIEARELTKIARLEVLKPAYGLSEK